MESIGFLLLHNNGPDIDTIRTELGSMNIRYMEIVGPGEDITCDLIADYPAVVIDIDGGDGATLDILKRLARWGKSDWVIVLADSESPAPVFEEIGDKIFAYITKPLKVNDFRLLVSNITEVSSLRREVTDKAKRVSHLEALNEIARLALKNYDERGLLWEIARFVHVLLSYFNVNIFFLDDARETIELKAFAGGFGADLVEGWRLPVGEGICGWVAQNSEPLLASDVRNEPRRVKGFSFEDNVLSELAVPIELSGRVLGVLHVESTEINAFSHDDIIVLSMVADQIALAFENRRLTREVREAYELSSTINDSLPVSIIIIDSVLKIQYVNRTFCLTVGCDSEQVVGTMLLDYFSEELFRTIDLNMHTNAVLESGTPVQFDNIHHVSPSHPDKILNIGMFRVQTGEHPRLMILIQDVTDFTKKTQQLSLIRQISIAMQGVFDLDKLLHMILTSVTAGFALGFNRAFLFLVDRDREKLVGRMGVGPRSHDEAWRIWSELGSQPFTLETYLNRIQNSEVGRSGLQDIAESLIFKLGSTDNILTNAVGTGQRVHITDAWDNPGVDAEMRKLIASSEFAIIPLIAKNEVIGVLFVDNAYTGKPITDESIEELAMFAMAAALAIENAHMLQMLEDKVAELEQAYSKLEKTHDMLVRHEKLAAIGEVSTRLAHEIRNPLATIGGFAKSIPRKYKDRERTIRNATIIVDEVQRLESILTNVLDFAKAAAPKKQLRNINELVTGTMRILEGEATKNNVIVVIDLAPGKLETKIDPAQIKQVLINVVQNAFNAMRDGGALEIMTREEDGVVRISVKDTGMGIPPEFLENIFDPFFTTRVDGTGLGLSISQRILQNHGGRIEINSEQGVGTTVAILLPVLR